MQVGELFATFSLDTDGFAKAVMGIEGELARIGAAAASAGALMERTITVPLAGLGQSAMQAGLSFTSQMSAVEAISGAAGESLAALRQAAIDAGSETSFTATQAGEALQYMAMAGWKTEDMLAGLRPVMDLAAASGADLASTSDIVTDAMTALGYRADETWKILRDGEAVDTGISNVRHFTDVLAATATSSNTNVEMLGESFKYAAPLAGALGYSVEDVAVTLGLMANQGIKASQAGTTLRSLFKRLADPPKAARNAMAEYGISLTDTEGNMKSLAEVMEQLRGASESMTETQKAAFASAIAGTTGMSGFLALLNSSEEDVQALQSAVEDCGNATEEMASVRLNNAAGAITIFKSAVEGLEITLFSYAEGAVIAAVKGLTDLVNSFRNAEPFVQKATAAFLAVTASIGPAVKGFGLLLPFVTGLVTPLGALTAGLGVLALTFLDFATAAGPAMDESGRYVKRGAGKIETAIRDLSGRGTERLARFSIQAQSYIASVSAAMPGMLEAIREAAASLLPVVTGTVLNLITAVGGGISRNMGGILEMGISILTGIAEGMARALPQVLSSAAQMLSSILTAFTDPVRIRGALGGIGRMFSEAFSGTDWAEIGTQLGSALTESIRNIRELAGSLREFLSGIDLTGVGEMIRDAFTGIGESLLDLILGQGFTEPSWRALGAKLNTWIRDGFGQAGQWLSQLILGNAGGTDYAAMGRRIAGWIRSGFEGFTDFLSGLILGPALDSSDWQETGRILWERICSGFDAAAGFLSGAVLGVADAEDWEELGQRIMDGIHAGMETAGTAVSSLLDSFEETDWQAMGAEIREKIQGGLEGIGTFLYEHFGTEGVNWEDLGGQIGSALRKGVQSVGSFLNGLLFGDAEPDLTALGQRLAEQIRDGFALRKGILESFIFGEETDWRERGRMVSEMIQSGFEFASQVLVTALGLDGSVDWADLGRSVWQKIQSGFDAAAQFLEGLFLGDGQSFTDLGREIWENVESGINSAKVTLVSLITDGDESVSVFQALGTRIAEALSSGMEGLRGLLGRLLNIGDEDGSWQEMGVSLFQKLLSGMQRAAAAAGEFLTGLIIGDDTDAGIEDAGRKLLELLLNGVTGALTEAGSLAGMLVESLLRFDWVPAGMEIGANLVKGITGAFLALRDGMEGFMRELFVGVKAAVLSWFGIEMDEITREMESRVFEIDGKKFTGQMLTNLISSSQATVTEQARAWVTLVQAGFEEQAGAFDAAPSALILAGRLESGMLEGQDRIRAAAALIFSGFGQSILNQDFDLYTEAVQLMQELYRGIEEGTDVTLEMCRELGLDVPATIAEALGNGEWEQSGAAASEGLNAALNALSAEADALASGLGRETGASYTAGVNEALAEAELDGDRVAEAMTQAAGEAAAAGGENLGRLVMESAADAVAQGREQLSAETAQATDPARFTSAEANARAAGGQIGGAIAPEITARLTDVERAVQAFTEAVGIGFAPVADTLRQGMKTAMEAVLDELEKGASEIETKMQTLAERMSALHPVVNTAGTGGTETEPKLQTPDISSLAREMIRGFESLSGGLTEILQSELAGMNDLLTEGGTVLTETLSAQMESLTALARSGGDALIEQTGTQMEQLAERFHLGLEKLKTDMTAAVSALHALYVPLAETLRQDTERMMQNMRQSFEGGAEQLRLSMQNLAAALLSAFLPLQQSLPESMRQAMQGLQSALESGGSMAASLASSVASRIAAGARCGLSSGTGSEIGRNFMSGMRSGIQSMASEVAGAASAAAASAVSAMKSTLKIKSPSRVTMEIGQYMDEGLALGLAGGEMVRAAGESVQKAVRTMADTAVIPELSRGAVPVRMEAPAGEPTAQMQTDRATAAEIAEILADRLIHSGALGGDLYLDGTRVGERVAEPVSRTISARTRLTIRGRSASGVLT